MTKNEMKNITHKWLLEKNFKKDGFAFYHLLDGFDICVSFLKDRFDECYNNQIGFFLHVDENAWGQIDVNMTQEYPDFFPSYDNATNPGVIVGKHTGFYYELWNKETYIECLDKIYDKYIQPYFDKGVEYMKEGIINNIYNLHNKTKEIIRNM